MWHRVNADSTGMISESQCSERAKRDEDRFKFFVQISNFVSDLKKANVFVHAKRAKESQRKAYEDLINAKQVQSPSLLSLTRLTEFHRHLVSFPLQ